MPIPTAPQEPDTSLSRTEKAAPSTKPMHLRMPTPQFQQPVMQSDHDGSSPDDATAGIQEEDVQSIVGVSISRAQTRLMSPQTPAAEKAAAMEELEGGGLFDGADDDHPERVFTGRNIEDRGVTATESTQTSTPPSRQCSTTLPSPWRAEPKTFEGQKTQHQDQHTHGPTSMLSDLNVRRYMSSFNLPSLPKTPSFKDFAVPSLSSIVSSTRSHSPLRRTEPRQKRASTVNEYGSTWGFGQPRPPFETRPKEDVGRGRPDPSAIQRDTNGDQSSELSQQRYVGRSRSRNGRHQRTASVTSTTSSRIPSLRRINSDQSLLLRRVISAGSEMGDDSRWENVQEQVNSRVKAIKDSFQDSSIKLPSMPNLSSLSLNSFRPDFTRSRAHSEAKRPNLNNQNADFGSSAALTNGHSAISQADKSANAEASQADRSTLKSSYSHFEEALEHLTGDLVVMGGYRGSILRSAQPPHRQLWVPVKVGLNIRRVNLEVGLQPEDEEDMHNHIFASGMLSHIGPVDMGRRLLKRLKSCRNAQEGKLRVHDYGWDWRLSPHLSSRRLLAFLQELQCNHPDVPTLEKGATVIAHSMGGLITRHAVNRRPELFAGVVYAGVPQHCVNILGPIRNGDEVLLSSKVLTAQVNFTLRSSFLLLPEDGKCFINKETKEAYPVNFFEVADWMGYAWSPCIAPALPPVNPPENKSLFGTVTDMFPSMPSLPIPGRKASSSPKEDKLSSSTTLDHAANKICDLTHPSAVQALDPQFSPHSNTLHANSQSTIPVHEAVTYLKRTLNATLAFKAEMIYDPTYAAENVYPPLSILYANNTPTVVAARVTSRDAIRHADAYDDLQFASGDGVCLARAAMLPDGYSCAKNGKVRTERGHVGLLGDLEAVGKCLLAIIEARGQGVGLGLKPQYDPT